MIAKIRKQFQENGKSMTLKHNSVDQLALHAFYS